jgi:hypothetical protein
MRQIRLVTFAAIIGVIAALSVQVATSASVHFKRPLPTFSKDASTFSLTASGINLSGLGNGDIRIIITGTGTATALCENPGGQSRVPGQNPVAVNVSGQVDVPATSFPNGNVTGLSVSTEDVPTPTTEQAGCPNDSWSVVGMTVTYSSATLTILQDDDGQNGVFDEPGTVVLTRTFTFSPAL